jgi:hypothetical protein
MCTSLEEITFKTVNGVRGKVFVYQHNKNTFTRTPYQNREFVYDVCEIVLDGIKSEDITDITASLNYKISWLRQNNINQDNVVLFTAENKDKNLEKRITLSRVGSDKDSIKVTAKLGVLPLVYAVAPQEEPKRGPLYLSWWIGSGIGVAGLLCGAVLFVRKKSS